MQVYVVKQGDTIDSIANKFLVSKERIVYDNEINDRTLVEGQALLILKPKIIYRIEAGDTLTAIANKFNTTVKQLIKNNSYLLNEDFIIPGRDLVISYTGRDPKNIDIFGYAYGFIKEAVLKESLLYINEILPFPYGFKEDGSLIEMNDQRLLETANLFGNKKRMVITPLDETGIFNNQLVVRLLNSQAIQENLINNILINMQEKGYEGLDIDFEFIPADVKSNYVSFIAETRRRLNENNYVVSVAVPPKISDEQTGILYEGIDYKGIGEAADSVFLMTYEWGYKYGPPMAIAPILNVKAVLNYAVSRIAKEKIDLGIPNYAYDWPLPYVNKKTVADTIGYLEAIQRAKKFKAIIQYDEVSKAPYFYYNKEGIDHVVWFEDIRSIVEKYQLIEEYGLKGGGYWNLMREFRQNWLYVNQII